MIITEVIQRVRVLAGDVSALQFSNEDVIAWINDGVRECAVTNNLLQKTASSTTAVGQDKYELPTDMLKIHSIKVGGRKLREITQAQYDDQYASDDTNPSSSGKPVVCFVWAGKLNLHPTPDSIGNLRIDYLYEPPPASTEQSSLASMVPLPVGYHSRIVDYCLAQVFLQDGDANGYTAKMTEFKTGVSELKDQPESTYDEYPSMGVSSRDMGSGMMDNWY